MGKFGGFWKRGKKENEPAAISGKDMYKSAEWCLKGDAQSMLGHPDKAVKCYDKALEIDPQNADAWFNKGFAQDQFGLKREAGVSYRKFVELAPARNATEIELVNLARKRATELEGAEPFGVATEESTPSKANRQDESQILCTGCSKPMPSSLEYCSNCGKKLKVTLGESGEIVDSARKEASEDKNIGKCPKCGTEASLPKKKWKMPGRSVMLEIGLFDCPKCHKQFRAVLSKKNI